MQIYNDLKRGKLFPLFQSGCRVGPNAINLREILVLSNPYGFPAGVAAAMLF